MACAACGALSLGCAAEAPAVTQRSGTFYQYDELAFGSGTSPFERPNQAFDRAATPARGALIGVDVLGGAVSFARPPGWRIRRASLQPERRYIEYVSPRQYVFALYERTDAPGDSWNDVLTRYEDDAKASKAELLSKRVPVAAAFLPGRAYVVKRNVRGARGPYVSRSREALFRSDTRVVLAVLVHQGEHPVLPAEELRAVYDSLTIR
jgi:hypothetical protein